MSVILTVVTYLVPLSPSYHPIQNSSALNTETEVDMGPDTLNEYYILY